MSKGIDHVVLLKIKDDATTEQVSNVLNMANDMVSIPGVLSISWGTSFVEDWMADRRQGFTHAICVRLESKEALRVYQDHPQHLTVKGELAKIFEMPPMAIDWESTLVTTSTE
mmetsp:Transcript_2852/g.3754  ORF Transcript_2852/g.3754 Transcript_2852/m.3754 type:complete len:113 (-) Transcript_2852:441-779(-)